MTRQIDFHRTTTLTPEQYVAGLTDFGPGRSKLFGNSADDYLKVHHLSRTEADVNEGSGGIWERLHLIGPIPTTSFLLRQTRICGAEPPATLTTSIETPKARPTLTQSSYVTART